MRPLLKDFMFSRLLVKFHLNQRLINRAIEGDSESLFQLGKKALFEDQKGFAKIFLTAATLNNHRQAKKWLRMIN